MHFNWVKLKLPKLQRVRKRIVQRKSFSTFLFMELTPRWVTFIAETTSTPTGLKLLAQTELLRMDKSTPLGQTHSNLLSYPVTLIRLLKQMQGSPFKLHKLHAGSHSMDLDKERIPPKPLRR